MTCKRAFAPWVFLIFLLSSMSAAAEPAVLKDFKPGSYAQLLQEHDGQPFMLVVWSITCPSCLKDMALLSNIHKKYPGLKIDMLSTDDATADDRIQQILAKNDLTDLKNWRYADDNTQKLQFEIDPKWYGELPRTYFFDKSHQRDAFSGILTEADYDARLGKILH